MKVSAVVFDLGGVLFNYQPDKRRQYFSELSGLPAAEIDRRLFYSGFSFACDRGEYSARETFEEGRSLLATRMTQQAFTAAWLSAFDPNRETIKFAKSLSGEFALATLSNNSALVRDGLNQKFSKAMQLFRLQIFSCEVGVVKPNPKMFATTATLLDRHPEEILIIDDDQHNTDVAEAMGFKTHHFHSHQALAKELAELTSKS